MKFLTKPVGIILVLIMSQQLWNIVFQGNWVEDVNISYSPCLPNNKCNIESINFEPITPTAPPVIKKGEYWLRLKLTEQQVEVDQVITLGSHNIKTIKTMHTDTTGLLLVENIKNGDNIIKSQYPSYVLRANNEGNVYYFHFTATKGTVLNISVKAESDFINKIVFGTLIRGGFYCILLFLCIFSFQNYYKYEQKSFLYRGLLNILFLSLLVYYDGEWDMIFGHMATTKYITPLLFILLTKVAGGLYSQSITKFVTDKNILSKWGNQVSNIAIVLFTYYYISADIRFFYAALCVLPLALALYVTEVYKAEGSMKIKLMYATPTITTLTIYSIYLVQIFTTSNVIIASITLVKASLLIEAVYGYYIQKVIITELKMSPQNSWGMRFSRYSIVFNNIFSREKFKKSRDIEKTTKVGIDLLSRREKEVCELIIQKYKNAEISEKLYISLNTVKFHRRNAYKKLGVSNQAELCQVIKPSTNTD